MIPAVIVLLLANHAIAGKESTIAVDKPEQFWGLSFSAPQAWDNYQITLRVKDPNEIALRLNKEVKAAGGSLSNQSPNQYQTGILTQHININLPAKSAESFAKKIMEWGELASYNYSRQEGRGKLVQVEERIEILEKELSANAKVLNGMPTASHFLKTRLRELQAARAALKSGQEKSLVTVQLLAKP